MSIESLKKANQLLEALKEAKLNEEKEKSEETEAMKLFAQMQGQENIIKAIEENKLTKEDLKEALLELKIEPQINVNIPDVKVPDIKVPEIKSPIIPEIKIPDIRIPEIKIPKIETPKIPEIKIPEIKIPKIKMPDKINIDGDVGLKGYGIENPLPVQLRDEKGKPVSLDVMVNSGGGVNNNGKYLKKIEDRLTNTISELNSSSTPLGIGGVFTGTAEDITQYAAITVVVYSDKASATDGLAIQFSVNGSNWDHIESHTISANSSHVTTNAPQGRYFRIVYTNGAIAQTAFRLQVIYSTESVGPIIEELGGDVSDNTSSITTKAILFAKNPAGVYGSIDRTTGGNLKVSIEEQEAIFAPTSTVLTTYSARITTNTTNTPTSSTAYISSIAISSEVAGTGSTITIQDKQGTPLKLVNGLATTALTTTPTILNFQTPIKMTSGIDIITAGAVAATVDVWINYYV